MATFNPTANQKYRRLIGSVVLLLVLAGAQPFLWRFVYAQALELQQKRSQGQQITNVKNRNEEIRTTIKKQKDFLDQLQVVSPPITSLTQAVERVEQLGDQLGLSVNITVIQELPSSSLVVKEEGIAPVSVAVDATGTANQLLSFLDRVEHTQELSIIRTWSLSPGAVVVSPGGAVPTNPPYTLSMDILFFLQRTSNGGQ